MLDSLRTRNHRFFLIALLMLSMTGAILLAYTTPYGMGLVNDSVGYISGARNIVSGDGYSRLTGDGSTRPITNYPPMYSVLLAIPILLGVESLVAAKWLNLLLFSLCTGFLGWMVFRLFHSYLVGLLGAVLFITSLPFFKVYTFALSEPVFILFYILSLFFIAVYLQKKSLTMLILAGLLSGLVVMTRYVGLSLYVTTAACILLIHSSWKSRLYHGAVFLVAGIPVALAWVLRNFFVTGNPANRQLIFHPIPVNKLEEGLFQFWQWLLPERGNLLERYLPFWALAFGFILVILVVGVGLGAWSLRRNLSLTNRNRIIPFFVLGLQALAFLIVLYASLTFLDASPPLDDRIMIPFSLCILLIGVGILSILWRQSSGILKGLSLMLALSLFLSTGSETRRWIDTNRGDGQGFASSYWRESHAVEIVDQHREHIVYTNKPTALYILINRPAYILLSPTNPATGLPREGYTEFVAEVRQKVMNGNAILVLFDYEELIQIQEEKDWLEPVVKDLPVLYTHGMDKIFGLDPRAY